MKLNSGAPARSGARSPMSCAASQVRLLPSYIVEEWRSARTAPAIRVQQPGDHLHDQRHGAVFPVFLLDQPAYTLETTVEVWIFDHEDCGLYDVELWYGGPNGEAKPEGNGVQIISRSACDYDGGGLITTGAGPCLSVFPQTMRQVSGE